MREELASVSEIEAREKEISSLHTRRVGLVFPLVICIIVLVAVALFAALLVNIALKIGVELPMWLVAIVVGLGLVTMAGIAICVAMNVWMGARERRMVDEQTEARADEMRDNWWKWAEEHDFPEGREPPDWMMMVFWEGGRYHYEPYERR